MTDVVLARSFDAWAADCDRFRPGYPVALFAAIAEALQLRALPDEAQGRLRDDLIRLLARHGHDQQQTIDVPYRLDLFTARRSGR